MRIRNAALAGATAIAVAFGGTTVASAASSSKPSTEVTAGAVATPTPTPTEDPKDPKADNDASSKKWQLDQPADGQVIFGSSKSEHCDKDETDKECSYFKDQPTWAKAFYGLGIGSAIIAVLSFIGQVYNFFVHGK